jgi:branched-chain amino acid transport system permease protein
MSEPTPATPTSAASSGWLSVARNRFLLIAGALVVIAIFFLGGESWLSILNIALIAAITTLGLNVLSGYAGQVSLGISFFMAVGAYTAALLGGGPPTFPGDPTGFGLSFLIWLPAAGIVAALIGAVVGPTALRLRGFYLGIVTIALVFIGQYLFNNLRPITGGPQGRSVPAPAIGSYSFAVPDPILGLQVTTNQLYFLLDVVLLALATLFVANVARSRVGRAWQAVRDNEVAASIMGVNLLTAKMGAFVLSSFLAGIAGALWASYPGYTEPSQWNLILSIQFVAALLIGGAGSVWGSILGAAFVFALPTALETFSLLPQSASSGGISSGDLSAIFYGLLIIAFLLFEPAGFIGLIRRAQRLARRFEESRKGGEGAQTPEVSDTQAQLEVEVTQLPPRTGTSLPGD